MCMYTFYVLIKPFFNINISAVYDTLEHLKISSDQKKNNEFEKTYINPTINDNFYLIANTEYHNPID